MKKKVMKVNKGREKPQGIIKQTTKVSRLKTTLFLKSRGDTRQTSTAKRNFLAAQT